MKKCLILGNINMTTHSNIFPLIKEGKLRCGYGWDKGILFTNGKKLGNTAWWQNIKEIAPKPLSLTKYYNEEEYPKYDNFDAIDVSKVNDIPINYFEPMGVPTTYLDKWDPDIFELIGITKSWDKNNLKTDPNRIHSPYINGKAKYTRLLIKRKKNDNG